MAKKVLSVTEFDYVFLNVGYTHRLMKDEINNRTYASDLNDYFSKEVDPNCIVLAVGCYHFPMPKNEWKSSEIHCDKETLNFLRDSQVSPFGCIVIKDIDHKVSLYDIASLIESLQKIQFCSCLSTIFFSMDIYDYQDKIIAKINYDTESG
ncbi:putative ORFan [Tupanvirus deep ocean]|uniref:ORFan n=2 Tax=Tupanvirus TaxID=2094720 RepID=A0AC62A6Z6_9VIRU|nr:putative ORFan [Tupanvirus deep ocean]QKU33560.1 putative ORFan [Tupanvirus deep ocean]